MAPYCRIVLLGCLLTAPRDAAATPPPGADPLSLICRRNLATERLADMLGDPSAGCESVSVSFHESAAALRESLQAPQDPRLSMPDLVVFDRIELAEFAARGWLLKLNGLAAGSGLFERLLPPWRAAYCEYPAASGDLYALPLNPDCLVLAINRALWEDAAARTSFETRHGAPLRVPVTCRDLVRVAQFFHRPSQGRCGFGWAAGGADASTAAIHAHMLRGICGAPWTADEARASGHVNSAAGRGALAICRQLAACAPPGAIAWRETDVLRALSDGRLALAIVWRSTLSRLLHEPALLIVSDLPRFGDVAAGRGAASEAGGQCIGIVRRSPNAAAAWRVIGWWMEEAQQRRWMEGGMVSPLAALLRPAADPAHPPGLDALLRAAGSSPPEYSHPASARVVDAIQSDLRDAIFGAGDGLALLDRCAAQADELLAGAAISTDMLVEIKLRAKPGGEQMLRERLHGWLAELPLQDGYLGFELRQSHAEARDIVLWQRWRGEAVAPTTASLARFPAWTAMIDECLSERPTIAIWRVLDSSSGPDRKTVQGRCASITSPDQSVIRQATVPRSMASIKQSGGGS